MSASRPSNAVSATGNESRGQFDRRVADRGAGAAEEGVAGCTSQVEGRGKRAHGLDMRTPSFPPLQRAHRMDGEPRNRREFLLRKPRGVAERLELRAK